MKLRCTAVAALLVLGCRAEPPQAVLEEEPQKKAASREAVKDRA
jgi:hypothetical protein